jgi:hypothetical protein
MAGTVDQFKSLVSAKGGLARNNLWRVKLPSLPGARSEEMNILCRDVQLPGRQITTNTFNYGLIQERVANGFLIQDVSMTFHVLNDYGVREYFETWQNLATNTNTYEVGYKKDYSRDVEIEQFKKVKSLPQRYRQEFSSGIGNALPKISDFELGETILGLNDQLNDLVIYKCKLIDAFPTTMNAIQLNNEMDGIVELNIQLSFTDWKAPFVVSPSNLKDALTSTIRSNIIGFVNNIF